MKNGVSFRSKMLVITRGYAFRGEIVMVSPSFQRPQLARCSLWLSLVSCYTSPWLSHGPIYRNKWFTCLPFLYNSMVDLKPWRSVNVITKLVNRETVSD